MQKRALGNRVPDNEDAHFWPDQEPDIPTCLRDAGLEVIAAQPEGVTEAQVDTIVERLAGPLHVDACRQALGCLIPPDLNPVLDHRQSRKRQQSSGVPGGCSNVCRCLGRFCV